jgi:Rieske Fe-S protein
MRVLVASSSATVLPVRNGRTFRTGYWLAELALPLDRLIRPGEGAVLSARSQKVAVYRDDGGALHTLDASCRHMGCTVNWDPAEKARAGRVLKKKELD